MFDPSKFTTTEPKPLPVYLLIDVSGTMGRIEDPENATPTGETRYEDGKHWIIVEGGTSKMDHLNEAMRKMLATWTEEEASGAEIRVSVVTFGDAATLYLPPTEVSRVKWSNLTAKGETAMGAALKMAKAMVEDKERTPSRAWRPLVVLVSDGQPRDEWEQPLAEFINQGRSSKCDRMALAIGSDADEQVLTRFIEGTSNDLFYAKNADQLRDFFKYVTMSVTSRSHSSNPNDIPDLSQLKNPEANSKEGNQSKADSENSNGTFDDQHEYW